MTQQPLSDTLSATPRAARQSEPLRMRYETYLAWADEDVHDVSSLRHGGRRAPRVPRDYGFLVEPSLAMGCRSIHPNTMHRADGRGDRGYPSTTAINKQEHTPYNLVKVFRNLRRVDKPKSIQRR